MEYSLNLLNDWVSEKQKSGEFSVPANATPVHIAAVSSDEKFDPAFLKGLHILELAMIEKGLNPDAFCINKYNASAGANYPGSADTNIILYGYELSFYDDRYSVRKKSDMEFLAYFSNLILSDEAQEPKDKKTRKSFIGKLAAWFSH